MRFRVLVWVAGGGAALLGLLAAAYTEMIILASGSRIGPVPFAVSWVFHAEALFFFAFGLFPGVVALLALWLRERGDPRRAVV